MRRRRRIGGYDGNGMHRHTLPTSTNRTMQCKIIIIRISSSKHSIIISIRIIIIVVVIVVVTTMNGGESGEHTTTSITARSRSSRGGGQGGGGVEEAGGDRHWGAGSRSPLILLGGGVNVHDVYKCAVRAEVACSVVKEVRAPPEDPRLNRRRVGPPSGLQHFSLQHLFTRNDLIRGGGPPTPLRPFDLQG